MSNHIRLPNVLTLGDSGRDLAAELRAVRAQAALVRSLLDEVDSLTYQAGSPQIAEAFAAQAVEELAELALRMLEAASALAPMRDLPAAHEGGAGRLVEEHARLS